MSLPSLAVMKKLGFERDGNGWTFDMDRLEVDPAYNVRTDLALDENGFHESIGKHGIEIPLVVRIVGKKVFTVAGHRRKASRDRHKAEGTALIRRAPVRITEKNDRELIYDLHSSNNSRPLAPAERARIMQRAVNFGEPLAEIAKRFGISQTAVNQNLDILKQNQSVIVALDTGRVSLNVVREAMTTFPNNPEKVAQVVERGLQVARRKGTDKVTQRGGNKHTVMPSMEKQTFSEIAQLLKKAKFAPSTIEAMERRVFPKDDGLDDAEIKNVIAALDDAGVAPFKVVWLRGRLVRRVIPKTK